MWKGLTMQAVMDRPGTKDLRVLRHRDIRYLREQGSLTLKEAIIIVDAAEAGDHRCMLTVARAHALELFAPRYSPGCSARSRQLLRA